MKGETHKQDTLLPAELVVLHEHLVRKRHLLVVARGEDADLVDHACEGAGGVCAAREAEDADAVAELVVLHEELVAGHDVVVEVVCEHEVDELVCFGVERRGDLRDGVCADARLRCRSAKGVDVIRQEGTHLVIAELAPAVALGEDAEELDDVGVVEVERVAGAVEAEDERAALVCGVVCARDDGAVVLGRQRGGGVDAVHGGGGDAQAAGVQLREARGGERVQQVRVVVLVGVPRVRVRAREARGVLRRMWVCRMRELDGVVGRRSRHWVGETDVRGEAVEARWAGMRRQDRRR